MPSAGTAFSSLLNRKEGIQEPIHLLAKGSVISPELSNLLIHVGLELINAFVEPGLAGLDFFLEPGLTGLDLFLESALAGLRLQPVHGQEGGYGSPRTGLGPFRKGRREGWQQQREPATFLSLPSKTRLMQPSPSYPSSKAPLHCISKSCSCCWSACQRAPTKPLGCHPPFFPLEPVYLQPLLKPSVRTACYSWPFPPSALAPVNCRNWAGVTIPMPRNEMD